MKKIFMMMMAATMVACSQSGKKAADSDILDVRQTAKGDAAVYGLACEGCSDSIVILLPYSGGDPDTFDIVDARRNRQVYGMPKTGNELAVIVNPEDKDEAVMVINVDDLKGKWCYKVMPTLKAAERMSPKMRKKFIDNMPDSMRQTFLVPREVGYDLRRNGVIHPVGIQQQAADDETSPVEYPQTKRYRSWAMYNGKIVFDKDTATIELMMKDSLVLDFGDHKQGFYRVGG